MDSLSSESIFTGTQGHVLRAIPAGTTASEGRAQWTRLLAVAEWSPDDKEESITIYTMDVRSEGGVTAPSNCSVLQRWAHDGSVTSVEVGDRGNGETVIVAGSSQGALSKLRFRANSGPDASPADIQWLDPKEDSPGVEAWLSLHSGSVSGVSISRDTHEVVSVGQDGAIFVVPLDATSRPSAYKPGRGSVSYRAVKWASSTTFVTAGTRGGVEVWDKRQPGGRPISRSPSSWGHTGSSSLDASKGCERRITCLDVHPSRPHLCATGASEGTVAVWDLRFETRPLQRSLPQSSFGDVCEVHFDSYEPYSEWGAPSTPSVLFSTDDGFLASASANVDSQPGSSSIQQQQGSGSQLATVLLSKVAGGIPSFGLDPVSGQDIFCLGGSECLMYIHRPSSQ